MGEIKPSGAYQTRVPLLEARAQAGLTQRELAERSGVSRTAIARMETTSWRTTPKRLERIATVLGVSTKTLLPSGGERSTNEERLRALYEQGFSWADIEAEFPGHVGGSVRSGGRRWLSECASSTPGRTANERHEALTKGGDAIRIFVTLFLTNERR